MPVHLKKQALGSACYDLFSAKSVDVHPRKTKANRNLPFKQLKLKFPKKYAFKIYPCSGLSLKPVTLGGGVTA